MTDAQESAIFIGALIGIVFLIRNRLGYPSRLALVIWVLLFTFGLGLMVRWLLANR
jgi:hypothetical protein